MVMMELEVTTEKPRPPPPPNFTAPFSSPSLQWARKKRLRCSNSLVDHRRRLRHQTSPSPDSPPHRSPSPMPSSPANDWQRPPIRPRTPRKEEAPEEVSAAVARWKSASGGDEDGQNVVDGEVGKVNENGNGEGRFLRSRAVGGEKGGKKKAELWVSLSREEIEEDFYSFTGLKLPRRPKKRPRTVVPHLLDRIFPGSWLPNTVTLEMYRVQQPAEPRKR